MRLTGFRRLHVCNYTGKLVKTILATCSEPIAEAIRSREPRTAKRLSVTPLYRIDGLRVEAVYPGGPARRAIEIPVVEEGEELYFEAGLGGPLTREAARIIECLGEGVEVGFCGARIRVEPLEAYRLAEYDTGGAPIIRLDDVEAIKLTLRSPTLPVNPWRPRSRWKRLLPAPSYLLAVNAHDLYDPDVETVQEALEAAEKILSPGHTALKTTRVRWYLYDGQTLPALTGYLKLHVELDGIGGREKTLVEHLLSHAAVMGIGSSRATGFGAVTVEPAPSTTPARATTGRRR